MNNKPQNLSVGKKINIIRHGKKKDRSFPSQILDIKDMNTFVVSGPIFKNMIVPIHINEIIEIVYIIENKGRFVFNAVVIKVDNEKIYKLTVKKIGELKKFQQRRFYRFPVNMEMQKTYNIEINDVEKTLIENCIIKDISGGGVKILSNLKHEKGDVVNCSFVIEDEKFEIKGEVIRVEESTDLSYKYFIGINFINIENNERDKIVKYIFKQQRKLRKKGMI